MENIPGNLDKELSNLSVPKPHKKKRAWSLLFVSDDGKMVPIHRFKGLTIFSTIILAIAIICALGFYYLYKISQEDTTKYKAALAQSDSQVRALKDERDILLSQLVIAQTQIKEPPSEETPEDSESTPNQNSCILGVRDLSLQKKLYGFSFEHYQ